LVNRRNSQMMLICTYCEEPYTGEDPPTTCRCGHPLEAQLDLRESVPATATVNLDDPSLWRYRTILPPIDDRHIMTLVEGWTDLRSGGDYGGATVYFKDETVNPTGSFKDRGMSLAVSHLKRSGVTEACLPSAGNAGVSVAAYCEEAGIECHVYLPEMIPSPFVKATEKYSAHVHLGGQTIAEAAARMNGEKEKRWFDLSTLKEPFRVEGKKTLGYEIAEHLDWHFPDVVVYPAGGGTGLVGMWKAFNEMKRLGWVEGALPRMVAVQSAGCAPVVKAFAAGALETVPWQDGDTAALGLNVANPLGGAWMLKVLRQSDGIAVMVNEEDVAVARKEVAISSGTESSPEAGVAWRGFQKLSGSGWIREGETVVIPITGSADRYEV